MRKFLNKFALILLSISFLHGMENENSYFLDYNLYYKKTIVEIEEAFPQFKMLDIENSNMKDKYTWFVYKTENKLIKIAANNAKGFNFYNPNTITKAEKSEFIASGFIYLLDINGDIISNNTYGIDDNIYYSYFKKLNTDFYITVKEIEDSLSISFNKNSSGSILYPYDIYTAIGNDYKITILTFTDANRELCLSSYWSISKLK